MNNYAESKAKLDAIRNKNEILFRMALSQFMDVAARNLSQDIIERTCKDIMKQDNKFPFMTNEFACELIRTTGEMAQIDHIHLLHYVSREIYYDVGDNELSYDTAIHLLKNCIEWITQNADNADARADLWDIGFCNNEIKKLGFEYLLSDVEEDKDDY